MDARSKARDKTAYITIGRTRFVKGSYDSAKGNAMCTLKEIENTMLTTCSCIQCLDGIGTIITRGEVVRDIKPIGLRMLAI